VNLVKLGEAPKAGPRHAPPAAGKAAPAPPLTKQPPRVKRIEDI
jgi:hypothetical protein